MAAIPTPPAPAWTRIALAGPHPGHGLERVPGGHENHRQSGRFLEGQSRGHPTHIGGPRQRVGGQSEDGEPEDPVSRRQMSHLRADRQHLARHLVAEDARVRRFAGIQAPGP